LKTGKVYSCFQNSVLFVDDSGILICVYSQINID